MDDGLWFKAEVQSQHRAASLRRQADLQSIRDSRARGLQRSGIPIASRYVEGTLTLLEEWLSTEIRWEDAEAFRNVIIQPFERFGAATGTSSCIYNEQLLDRVL